VSRQERYDAPWVIDDRQARRSRSATTYDASTMRELLANVTAALDARRECVFCSLVETRGSTPQKAGAAMLVFPDGSQAGTLGGGCVEAEVKRRALAVLGDGRDKPEVLTFCLDDNYGWDDGLICGGRMTILAEPLTLRRPEAGDYFRCLRQHIDSGQGCTEAVVISEQPEKAIPTGSRYLFDNANQLITHLGDGSAGANAARHLVRLDKRPGAFVQQGIAYLPILPRVTLFIVGGGHVGHAVAKLAADVDFDIWALDDRERYASRERFPMAQRRFVGDIGATLKQLVAEITPSFFCLIVTRGHAHDEEALYHLAPTCAGYVGMIGSKRKIKLIYDDLLAKGIPEGTLARVHAPLGFDIGSQTVPEIAVSIVAELIACRNKGQTIPAARIHVSPKAARA
jgi:xanthine dehydrogenase accessory factor